MIATLRRLLPADQRRRAGVYVALTLLSVVIRAAGIVLLVPLVGALFSDTPADALGWLGALTAATAAGWVIDAAAARRGFQLGFAALNRTQHVVADRLAEVRLDWFTAETTATARQAIATTGPELLGLLVYLGAPLTTALLLPAAIGVALLPISWPLGLAALAGVPLLLGAMAASVRLSRNADAAADAANSVLTERIIEFARTQPALRAARRADQSRSLVGEALAAQHGAMLRLLGMQIPGQLLFSLASQAALIGLAGAVTALTVNGSLSVPEAIALIVVIVRYLEPFTTVSELAPAWDSTRATLTRIHTVLTAPQLSSGQAHLPDPAGAPRIEFVDVTFGYGDREADAAETAGADAVLHGINLVLQPGTTTAVVGPSGSGKSSLLALIAGLHRPTGGRVLIDGVDVATLDPEQRRAATSVVFQHPYLFDGSVRDNALAGDPDADEQRWRTVAALARVDELIDRLPDGEATRAGEAGGALSGGERQRVSIARALLKPAPVLLVDEATSALDTENEAAVVAALTASLRPRTQVVVAHRLASIRHADRVVFLDAGRIIEDGTVEELLAAGGPFAQFWRHQQQAAHWQITAEPTG
ncbi:iron ABC transporter permease [Mycolicibacillus koreensis]|nr:iron ABC transporter permease [Mycolicibacillus koreensis]